MVHISYILKHHVIYGKDKTQSMAEIWLIYSYLREGRGFVVMFKEDFIYNADFFFFWLHHKTCGISVPWLGIKLVFPLLEAPSLNHWTPKEAPNAVFSAYVFIIIGIWLNLTKIMGIFFPIYVVLWSECLCFSRFCVAILIPNGLLLGGGVFRRWWGHKGSEWDWGPHKREPSQVPCPFYVMRT